MTDSNFLGATEAPAPPAAVNSLPMTRAGQYGLLGPDAAPPTEPIPLGLRREDLERCQADANEHAAALLFASPTEPGAVDITAVATAALVDELTNPQHVDLWRAAAIRVREAVAPYAHPTPEAYEAAVRALDHHRMVEQITRRRAVQLAGQAQEYYFRLRELLRVHGDEDDALWLDDARKQLDETLCTGEHAEGEPCIDFRSVT